MHLHNIYAYIDICIYFQQLILRVSLIKMNFKQKDQQQQAQLQSNHHFQQTSKQQIDGDEVPQQIIFDVLRNHENSSRNVMKMFIDIKNIFSKQIPFMPKPYITRLIFDGKHECLVLIKKYEIIGGICFRQFPQQHFVELVFLAISNSEQVKGYGSKIINKFKNLMKQRHIQYIITYADNNAIGFFKKHAFSEEVTMIESRWKGYVKIYQGGQFMQCYVHPKINYEQIQQTLIKQKNDLLKKVKNITINNIPYEGVFLQNTIKKKYGKLYKSSTNETFLINPEHIPGVMEGGWSWESHNQFIKNQPLSYHLSFHQILSIIRKHSLSHLIVKYMQNPIHYEKSTQTCNQKYPKETIQNIEKKVISEDIYKSKVDFIKDLKKLFHKFKIYYDKNLYEHQHKYICDIEDYIQPYLNLLRDNKLVIHPLAMFYKENAANKPEDKKKNKDKNEESGKEVKKKKNKRK